MGFSMHYAKIVGGGILAALLVVAVIVLGVEVARLSSELNDLQNDITTPTSIPGTTTEDPSSLEPWDREYRLPSSVQPSHYDLLLFPKFYDSAEKPSFTGTVKIFVTLTAPQEFLAFHEKDLVIVSTPLVRYITGGVPQTIAISEHFKAPRNEFYILKSTQNFASGEYELTIEFSGSLDKSDLVGFYTSKYVDPANPGDEHKLATSKFEPTYARRAFPCMDEPEKKATYTISLVKPSEDAWTALSNTKVEEVKSDTPEAGYSTVTYTKTVAMSTYLACFIVSEFKSLGPKLIINGEVGGQLQTFPLKTWAPEHLIEYTKEALDVGEAVTNYYIKYFDIPYPLPKLDLIAIPDFVSGAMEHWGLVTFRETSMIINPAESSASNVQRVCEVVAHEIAHMWFGNLVTMKWWDDLWLNEGFASYIEYKGVEKAKGLEWQMQGQFVIQDLQPVMALDAQLSSHPIIQPVAHPDQITELFDTITYSKGSAVLRMLENFLGEENFQIGIQNYLKAFSYGNAETPDLWAKLQEKAPAGVDVTRTMDTWTKQMGLPVLNVVAGNAGDIIITQERFLATPEESRKNKKEVESPYGYRWDIPITYRKQGPDQYPLKWLKMDEDKVTIDLSNKKWIKLNTDQIGVYRVNYYPEMWTNLKEAFKLFDSDLNEGLTPVDRSSLLDDAFSLAEANLLDYSVALEFGEAMSYIDSTGKSLGEVEYIPWVTAASRFKQITPLMRGKLAFPNYLKYLRDGVNFVNTEIDLWGGLSTADHITKRLTSVVLDHACSIGVEDCLQNAGEQFDLWISDTVTNKVDPNLRVVVYTYGMKHNGNSVTWQTVFDLYKTEKDPQERSKLLLSLASINDINVLQIFIELAWDESNVRGQDYFTVLQNIADNPVGTSLVWDYVRENWQKLVGRFSLNDRYLGRMIPRITQNFNTNIRLQEMNQFFAAYPDAGAGVSSRAQALERVENNIKWMEVQYPKIEEWLNKKYSRN